MEKRLRFLEHSELSHEAPFPESVKATVAAINKELRLKPKTAEAS